MNFVHRWNGEYFGWFHDDALYSKDGRHVGYRRRNEVFDLKGRYLGEVKNHRLITRTAKVGSTGIGGVPMLRTVGTNVNPTNEQPLDLPDGFDDFPSSESL
ncbi:4-fold beta flower protein [Mesorhizobium sp. M2C.T.Ca.TU.002.02.1.1]|jgi:hypothetical protein|uniref:4-fold beta flower protein n=1 Tax=Mesorhizobium sp. M2C.T.Ca.TU.002.02.1.1 TaxID=2496788 RepID=UPI000FCC9F2F|nr:hypothetical protein [Mesorhizobium sp. M2C.T.Ca.TU.002.02.1.1]RUU60973.1 hypothetical protein EOD07_02490 [Mesorhizobium sp. M2C.T.Ca.TU.002.02.1.1]RUU72038.1 hypothetical protein EOD04_00365 [Mesorhizobium sp. M2C.T.Ca.TU.009.01.2.1]